MAITVNSVNEVNTIGVGDPTGIFRGAQFNITTDGNPNPLGPLVGSLLNPGSGNQGAGVSIVSGGNDTGSATFIPCLDGTGQNLVFRNTTDGTVTTGQATTNLLISAIVAF